MDVVMPQLGETVDRGTVAAWRKAVGDRVEKNEPLFDVETDKVATEIPAPAAGVLREILVPEGETVKVGARLAVIEVEGEARTVAPAPSSTPSAPAEPSGSRSPRPGRGERDQGPPSQLRPQSGRSLASPPLSPASGSSGPLRGGEGVRGAMKLSPVVRRLLEEHHLDAADIAGTGAEGRITRDDVLAFVEKHGSRGRAVEKTAASGHLPATARAGERVQTGHLPPPGRGRVGERVAARESPPADDDTTVVPMNRIRKLTAAHTARSAATAPHVLQAVEVDFSTVDEARRAASAGAGRAQLSYLPFVARAVCEAIREFPHVNASVSGESLLVHRRVNLGIAVDLSFEGLVVPVVKDAQRKSLHELAAEMRALAEKAKRGELAPDDVAGGTYTISNNGAFGTLITAPIIHQPQVAVLSTDGVRKRPVVVEGQDGDAVAIRPVGVLAQCFDHRAFDGAYSAAFLARVKDILERRDWRAELG